MRDERDFTMVFMPALFKIRYILDVRVLAQLTFWMDANCNVALSAKKRQTMRAMFGITNSCISSSIKRLKELEIISGGDGEFKLNPDYFRVKK